MKLDYNSREIFFGNEALIVADMAKGSNGKPEFTNHKIVTGLVSVGSMEDQAETNSLSLIHISRPRPAAGRKKAFFAAKSRKISPNLAKSLLNFNYRDIC